MPSYLHPDWWARNALRAYPLQETAPRVSDRGWTLADDLLVDLSLTVATSPAAGVCLQSVCLTPGIVSVVLADAASGLALGTAAAPAGPLGLAVDVTGGFQSVVVLPVPGGPGLAGTVTFGPALSAARYPGLLSFAGTGTHRFTAGDVFAVRTVFAPGATPVRSLNDQSGDVALAFGGDLRVAASTLPSPEGDGGGNVTVLTLSLVAPEKYLSPCDPSAGNPCGTRRPPIRSINGVRGDPTTGSGERQLRGLYRHAQRRQLGAGAPAPDRPGFLPLRAAARRRRAAAARLRRRPRPHDGVLTAY